MIDAKKARKILQKASNLLLLLVLCSCDGTIFHKFHSLDDGWQREDTLVYMYDNGYANAGLCGAYVEVRTTAGYRYKNLLVRTECLALQDSSSIVDTVPLVIYDSNGVHMGATAGMLYQQKSEMRLLNLPVGDSVVIRLSHIMPADTLIGVTDVGIRLISLH